MTIAPTLAEARAKISSTAPPSHVILDLMLPDGDGATLLQFIRAHKLPIWVGVTTGVNDPDRMKIVNDLHPGIVLRKPIDLMQLMSALKA